MILTKREILNKLFNLLDKSINTKNEFFTDGNCDIN